MFNAGKIRTMGKMFLKLETRGKDGTHKKMILILFSYLLPGIFLPFLLYKQNSDPGGFDYAFLSFLFFTLVVSFSILSELDNLLISKTEANIFTSLPVDDDLIVNAKMYVFWRYVFITSIPLLLPGSIFFYFILHSIPRAIMYYFSGLVMCLFLVYVLLLLYAFAMHVFKTTKLSTYTLFLQIILIFLLIISYQFVSFSFTGKQISFLGSYMQMIQSREIIGYFPPAWFAFIPARHAYIPDYKFIIKIILPFIIVLLSYFSLKLYLLEKFPSLRAKYQMSLIFYNNASKSNMSFLLVSINKFLSFFYLRKNIENASFFLMQSLYRKDKTVKLNVLPMIVIPIGLGIFALITNQLPSPFVYYYFDVKPVFHISILISILVVLNTGILGVRVTNYTGVSWVYDAYPIGSKKGFINGVRKFFVVYMLVPICLLLFIMFTIKMAVYYAIVHTLYIFACANFYISLIHIFNKNLPFTKENTLLNSVQRITSLLFPFLFGIFFILIQFYVYKKIMYSIIAVISVFAITFCVNYFVYHRKS